MSSRASAALARNDRVEPAPAENASHALPQASVEAERRRRVVAASASVEGAASGEAPDVPTGRILSAKGRESLAQRPAEPRTINPSHPYEVAKGDTFFAISSKIRSAGYAPHLTVTQIARELSAFHGRELRAGDKLNIGRFLERLGSQAQHTVSSSAGWDAHGVYQFSAKETLFSVVKAYRDSLPAKDPLRAVSVMEIVQTARRMRRERDADCPVEIQAGEKINLRTVFSMHQIRLTRAQVAQEGSAAGSRIDADADRRPTGEVKRSAPSRAPRFLDRGDMERVVRQGIVAALKIYGVRISVDAALEHAGQESSWNSNAHNTTVNPPARGLYQLRPNAACEARSVLMQNGLWPEKFKHWSTGFDREMLYSPEANALLALTYLAKYSKRFGGVDNGLAAFNQGPTRWEAVLDRNPFAAAGLDYVKDVKSWGERNSAKFGKSAPFAWLWSH